MRKVLKIVTVACITVIFATSAFLILYHKPIFSEKDFPLEVELRKNIFNVGEKISLNATIVNKSGKDVNISSNGETPCVFFHNINDTTTHGETTERVDQIIKANDKISRVFEYEAIEPGTYILDVHYRIEVNNIAIQNKIDAISIEVR